MVHHIVAVVGLLVSELVNVNRSCNVITCIGGKSWGWEKTLGGLPALAQNRDCTEDHISATICRTPWPIDTGHYSFTDHDRMKGWVQDLQTFQDPFFKIFANQPPSCLHHLIPPARDTSITTRLRVTTSLPRPNLRTKKYCSLINFGLHHYQPT